MHAGRGEQIRREPERQTHHAEEVTLDSFHQQSAATLHPVTTGFVQRLPGFHVRTSGLPRERTHPDSRDVDPIRYMVPVRQRDTGHDPMHPPCHPAEHLFRILRRGGLAQNVSGENNERVRREDGSFGMACRNGGGFLPREPDGRLLGKLTGPDLFLDTRGIDEVVDPDHLQQLPSAR